MKLGTDAVLLGCYASHADPKTILDIGTGSGVIALQLAQRFAQATITALEIDPAATAQAQANFNDSAWSDRLQAIQEDVVSWTSEQPFDLICCNPPFYENSFPVLDAQRRMARSHVQLGFKQLAQSVTRLLAPSGSFWVILPVEALQRLQTCLLEEGLYPHEIISIHPKSDKACNRKVAHFKKTVSGAAKEQTICIRNSDNSYTAAYKDLTAAFYLGLR